MDKLIEYKFTYCETLCRQIRIVRFSLRISISLHVETVRPYSTKPATQEMSLMALTLYFWTQTLYTKYKIEEKPALREAEDGIGGLFNSNICISFKHSRTWQTTFWTSLGLVLVVSSSGLVTCHVSRCKKTVHLEIRLD